MLGGVAVALAMKPIQVYLRQDQIEPLRAEAARRGVSLAELVRQGVDHVLQEAPVEEDPLWKVVGIMDSGVGDLADEHDKYLAEIYARENRE
jgi:intracellular sulfur oxidation DsrE/DsrF family protein